MTTINIFSHSDHVTRTSRPCTRAQRRAGIATACGLAALTGATLLTGCNSQSGPQPVAQQAVRTAPRDAERVAQGTRELSYKAPTDGTVYAEDTQTGETVFRERLRAGQRIDFHADNGTLAIDNKPVRLSNLDTHRGHSFRMYFDKSQQ